MDGDAAALARMPWGLGFGVGLALVVVSFVVGVRVARPADAPAVAWTNVTCAQAARLVRDPGAQGRLVVVRGVIRPDSPQAAQGLLHCDDAWVQARASWAFVSNPRASTAIAARVSDNALSILSSCENCVDPTALALDAVNPARGSWTAHVVAMIFGALGMLFVAWALRRRPARRAVIDAIRTSPAEAERVAVGRADGPLELARLGDGAVTAIASSVVVVRDGVPVGGHAGMSAAIERRDRGGYRDAPDASPMLVGPGAVNGIAVPAGERAVLGHRDIVQLGAGPGFSLELAGMATSTALRYRYDRSGRVRVLRTRRAWGMTLLSIVAMLGALALVHFDEVRPPFADPLALVLVVIAVGAMSRTPAGGHRWVFVARDLEGEALRPHPPRADDEGGWEWHATDVGSRRSVLLERVPPADLTTSRDEVRLRAHLLRESELVAERSATPAHVAPGACAVDEPPHRRPPVRG